MIKIRFYKDDYLQKLILRFFSQPFQDAFSTTYWEFFKKKSLYRIDVENNHIIISYGIYSRK